MSGTTDQQFEHDVRNGQALFLKFKPLLEAAIVESAKQNGNSRDVMLGFLSSFGGFVGRHVGLNAAVSLFDDARKILKRVAN